MTLNATIQLFVLGMTIGLLVGGLFVSSLPHRRQVKFLYLQASSMKDFNFQKTIEHAKIPGK